jgi:type VI secretion system protein ImpA
MSSFQPFLGPIPGDNPCGKDIRYDAAFLDLETLAKGKEETQFSTLSKAELEPNWKQVQTAALELLPKSKHLRLGILATLASLQLEGLPGFANGMVLLADWTKNHWDGLYPSLDPEDNNDPTERVNLLQALCSPDSAGDRVLQRLAGVPLAESAQLGRYSLRSILESPGKPEIDAAFRDTDKETLQLRYGAAGDAIAAVKAMQESLTEKLGAGRAPNFHELDAMLKQIQNRIAPYLGQETLAPEISTETSSGGPSPGVVQGRNATPGTIANREDVVNALRAVCAYYKSHEPASPIPLLLERAQRLVNKDFLEIINDMAPDSMAQISLISGKQPEK